MHVNIFEINFRNCFYFELVTLEDLQHMLYSLIYNLNQLVHSDEEMYYLFAKCFAEG